MKVVIGSPMSLSSCIHFGKIVSTRTPCDMIYICTLYDMDLDVGIQQTALITKQLGKFIEIRRVNPPAVLALAFSNKFRLFFIFFHSGLTHFFHQCLNRIPFV